MTATDPVTSALSASSGVASAGQQDLTGLAGWVVDVVDALGAVGVGLLVAAENLFPPIPSEVILPVAGYVASQGRMNLLAAVVAATLGSLLGALALYGLGSGVGQHRLRRWAELMPLVEVQDLDRAERWFDRHGGRAVLIGRCVPVVRSLISIPAGVERMALPKFVLYTLAGSGVWNTIFIIAGYQLGSRWQDIGRYSDLLNTAVLAAIALCVAYLVISRLRRRARTHAG